MAQSDQFYLDLVVTVDEVLSEFGKDYIVQAEGDFDPIEGEEITIGTQRTVLGVVAEQHFTNSIINGLGKEWHATKSLILSASAAPEEGEVIEVDGKKYPMSDLESVKPADIVVVYLLDLTR